MKMKKIKVKKVNPNHKKIQSKVKAMNKANKAAPKKISTGMLIFLIITALAFFASCWYIFGILVALAFVFVYILMLLLVRTIDKYPPGNKKRRRAKNTFMILLLIGIIGILAFIIFFISVILAAPDFDVKKLKNSETTLIYDKNKNQIAALGNEKREKIDYEDLPNVLVDAIVSTEDSRFFQHNGFDAPRFTKAVMGQLAGRDAGGGSTLTMQVSKNSFTSTEASGIKGIIRKFTDIYMAIFKIERAYTKEQIIEFYVNGPFLGSNSYGVEQAAQTYFGKHASQMNLAEASLIAGLFQAPGMYDPYENPEAAKERRATVLSLMVRHGYITEEEEAIANATEIKDLLLDTKASSSNIYQDYIDLVVDEVVNKTGMDPYLTPMVIYTNMDAKKQLALRQVFRGKTYNWINSTIQGSAVAVDTKTGKIIAIAAGRNRTGERTFNYATDISRQIGSTAKPLFDYGPAIEYEDWSTGHIINDSPMTYSGGGTRIVNYDGAYRGNMSIRYALSDSRNVPAVKTFQSVDNAKIKKFVTTLGIKPEIDVNGYIHEAHALGAFNGASPLQIAGAYTAFANYGVYHEPYAVSKIILRDSEEKVEFESEGVKAMSDATAYMITDILREVPGRNYMSGITSDQYAIKTGTTNYDEATTARYGYSSDAAPDGWVTGYTPSISLSVWTGYVKNKKGVYLTMNEMYNHKNNLFIACGKAIFNNKGESWTKPNSVVRVQLEKGTEQLASSYTPKSMIVTELFKRGTVPKTTSNKYNRLENPSNLSLKYANGVVTLSWSPATKPKDIKDNFGEFGYYVSLNGETLGFTTGTTYVYSGANPFGTYTVRTAFRNVSTNMSSGISKTLNQNIKITSNVDSSVTLSVGDSYSPVSKPFTVLENGVDVTNDATVSYTITKNGSTVSSIDTSSAGTYVITYTVKYDGESSTAKTTVTVNQTEPTEPTEPDTGD